MILRFPLKLSLFDEFVRVLNRRTGLYQVVMHEENFKHYGGLFLTER